METNLVKAIRVLLKQLENEHLSEFCEEPIESIKFILDKMPIPIPVQLKECNNIHVTFKGDILNIEQK